MKIKTIVGSLAALSALVLATVIPVGPALAAPGGSCSIVVPQNVSIVRPYTVITGSLASDCATSGAVFASWDLVHSYYGPSDLFIFDGAARDTISFYDWDHLGTYRVMADRGSAWDADYNYLTQNSRAMYVKVGSRTGISATRLGGYVTVRVANTYYSSATQTFRTRGYAVATIQSRSCSTCTWVYVKTVASAPNGVAAYRTYAPRSRYYRAVSRATSSVWGSTSASVVR